MKILDVSKESIETISYTVEYEFECKKFTATFESYDWQLSNEEIIEEIKNNPTVLIQRKETK